MKKTLLVLAVCGAVAGCAPNIAYRIDTAIKEDGVCARNVLIKGTPSEKLPNQRVQLRNYLELPEAERYENFVLSGDRAAFNGVFKDPRKIPADFAKLTPNTDRLAKNTVLFRTVDLGLATVMEYEERFGDIVTREEGVRMLDGLTKLVLEALLNVLHDRFDAQYDISRLDAYLKENVAAVARDLYQAAWEIRRAKRGGVEMVREEDEWWARIVEELGKLGVKVPDGEGDLEKRIGDAAREFAAAKLKELTSPRKPEIPPLDASMVEDKESRERLLASLQQALANRYGSLEQFVAALEPLLPKIVGAFYMRDLSVLPLNPSFDFHVELQMPGHVIQTNGFRDLNGRLVWSFTDRDIALAGFSLWARSVVVRDTAAEKLGLKNFPGSIANVEVFYRVLYRQPQAATEAVVARLRECAEQGSLDPLRQAAAASGDGADKDTAAAAAAALEFLQKFVPAPEAGAKSGPELGDAPGGR